MLQEKWRQQDAKRKIERNGVRDRDGERDRNGERYRNGERECVLRLQNNEPVFSVHLLYINLEASGGEL